MLVYNLKNVFHYVESNSSIDYHTITEASIVEVFTHMFEGTNLILLVKAKTIKFDEINVEINLNDNEALYDNDIINNYLLNNCLIENNDDMSIKDEDDMSIRLKLIERKQIEIEKVHIFCYYFSYFVLFLS